MAAANQADALFVSGQLCANATDLTAAFPHGGTALGLVGGVEQRVASGFRLLIEEETNAPYGVVILGGPVELLVRLRGWDEDAVSNLFPGGSQTAARPLIALLPTYGEIPTALDNVVWSPLNSTYPHVVMRDVIAVPENEHRPAFTAYRHLEFRLRLFSTNVSTSLGEIGHSQDVTL